MEHRVAVGAYHREILDTRHARCLGERQLPKVVHLQNANGIPIKQGREIGGARRADPAPTLKRDAPKAIATSAHQHPAFLAQCPLSLPERPSADKDRPQPLPVQIQEAAAVWFPRLRHGGEAARIGRPFPARRSRDHSGQWHRAFEQPQTADVCLIRWPAAKDGRLGGTSDAASCDEPAIWNIKGHVIADGRGLRHNPIDSFLRLALRTMFANSSFWLTRTWSISVPPCS